MDERRAMMITEQLMTDKHPMWVTITIADIWLVIGALQLVVRQSELSDALKQRCEGIGRQLQDGVTERHPIAEQLLEMGWDTDFDMR
jgi:hypothetical protein